MVSASTKKRKLQQKEQILRTQIRVLQNELGEDEDNEIEEYRQKLAELKLEDETREHLEKEINKLAKQPYVSAEASVIRNYLDVCLELPWGTYTKQNNSTCCATLSDW